MVASSTVPPSATHSPAATSTLNSVDDDADGVVVGSEKDGAVDVSRAFAAGTACPSTWVAHPPSTPAAANAIAAPAAPRRMFMVEEPTEVLPVPVRGGTMCRMDLPVVPPLAPMLAKVSSTVPSQPENGPDEWSYEPKWDGFRAIVFRDVYEVVLCSRGGKDFDRYFHGLAYDPRPVL